MRLDLRNVPHYYLNTAARTDRRAHMENRLTGFIHERIEGPAPTGAGQSSLVLGAVGHARVLEYAVRCMAGRFEPFVLLEDDVEWRQPPAGPVLLEVPDHADAVHLGISECGCRHDENDFGAPVLRWRSLGHPHLHRVYNMLSTHAILFLSYRFCQAYSRAMMEASVLSQHTPTVWDTVANRLSAGYEVYALAEPLLHQFGPVGGQEGATKIVWTDDGAGLDPRDRFPGRAYHAIRPCSGLLTTLSPTLTIVAPVSTAEDLEQLRSFEVTGTAALAVCMNRASLDRALYDRAKAALPFAKILLSDAGSAVEMLSEAMRVNPHASYKFLFVARAADARTRLTAEALRPGSVGEHPRGSAGAQPALLGGDLDSLLEFISAPGRYRERELVYDLAP
jgi:hypothetical protein